MAEGRMLLTESIEPEEAAGRPGRGMGAADVGVGILFGLLAGSNLVQGAWLPKYPWLNLTTVAFALALPVSLFGLRRRTTVTASILILLLMFALALGYLEPPLGASAEQKRINLIVGVAFVFVASYLSLNNSRRLKWFCGTIACLAIPVMVGQVVAPDALALASGRRTPVGLNAIGAARAVGSALVLTIAVLVTARKAQHRIPLALLALALSVSLYAGGSRGPIIGVLVAILLIVSKHPRLHRMPKIALLFTLALIAGLVYWRSKLTGSRLTELTTSGRNELYAQAVQIGLGHPLGVGWGNYYRFAGAGPSGNQFADTRYVHNVILEFWIEAGTIAALAFVVVVIAVLITAFRGANLGTLGLALAALAVSLLTGAMLSSDVIGNRMMWVVLAAVMASGVSARATRRRPNS